MKSLKLLVALIEDLMRTYPECRRSLERDLVTLVRRTENEGLSFLTKTLPILGDSIFDGLENGFLIVPSNFCKRAALPALLSGLLEKVFDSRTGSVKGDPDVSAISDLRQVCYTFKKMLGNQRKEEILDQIACASFFDVEADIPDICPDKSLYADIQTVSRNLWKPTSFEEIDLCSPRNGPGGVSEKLTSNQKYSQILADLNDLEISREMGYTFIEMNALDKAPKLTQHTSRLISVPKNSTSRRTITIEPCSRMFIQQHLNAVIRLKIERSPKLIRTLTLNDQSTSKKRALESSAKQNLATVDLSSASDRLSLWLVQCVFAHDNVLLSRLEGSRTPQVEWSGKTFTLKKYAGMGNATTFPVQSIVFTVLSVIAILRSANTRPTRRNIVRAVQSVTVYGDDIILPSTAYSDLVEIMTTLGLRVNTKKSFVKGLFRESCGTDAYNGSEITPIYVRNDLDCEMNPSRVISAISTSNLLWDRGYYSASNLIKREVENHLGRLPLVRRGSRCMGWHTRNDAQEYGRFCRTLYRFETRSYVSNPKMRKDSISDMPRLLMGLVASRDGESQAPVDQTSQRGVILLKRRWAF